MYYIQLHRKSNGYLICYISHKITKRHKHNNILFCVGIFIKTKSNITLFVREESLKNIDFTTILKAR